MLPHIHHLGRQDTGGAIQGGECLIELSHPPADGRFPFDQIDGEARIGDIKGGLNAGNTATDD